MRWFRRRIPPLWPPDDEREEPDWLPEDADRTNTAPAPHQGGTDRVAEVDGEPGILHEK